MIIYKDGPHSQVSRSPETGTYYIPYLVRCRRHPHYAYTVLHDLLALGCGWGELVEVRGQMDLPNGKDDQEYIESYVRRYGRIVVDSFCHGGAGFLCHVEPVIREC